MKVMRKSLLAVGILLLGLLTSASSCAKLALHLGDYRYTETIQKDIPFAGKTELGLENSVGSIAIEGWTRDSIELAATKKARSQRDLKELRIEIEEDLRGVEIRSVHPKGRSVRWAVDYRLKVPAGTHISIDQGVGEISVANHEGTVSIDLGTGDVKLEGIRALKISVDVGVGDVDLVDIESKSISASVGTGDLDVRLRPDASFKVSADVGLGDVTIEGFPDMKLESEGFISQRVRALLGKGEGELDLNVGVGDIDVRPIRSQ